jgi:hypothetical protein
MKDDFVNLALRGTSIISIRNAAEAGLGGVMNSEIDWTPWTILGLFVFAFICLGIEPFVDHVWPLLRRIVREFLYWTVSDDFANDDDERDDTPGTEG